MFKEQKQEGEVQEECPRFHRSPLRHPTFRPAARHSGDSSLLAVPDHVSMTSMKEQDEREFSIRSIKTTKNPSRSPLRLNLSAQLSEEGLRGSPPTTKELTQYANIERILKNENENLKMQNELLLREVQRLRQSSRKYKEEYKKVSVEIEGVRLECEAQRHRADQMKDIIMSRLAQLQGRIEAEEDSHHLAASECESILEALTLSESGTK